MAALQVPLKLQFAIADTFSPTDLSKIVICTIFVGSRIIRLHYGVEICYNPR